MAGGTTVQSRGFSALWQRLTLRRRARRAHAEARGSLHVPMLREAQGRLEGELQRCSDALGAVEKACARIEAARDEELITALSHHLVLTRLAEVSGIGMKDHADILREVFDRNLEDLRSAHWILGLSEGRQRAINDWILSYRRQFPRLLQEDFPGRNEVLARYRRPLGELEAQIAELRAERDEVQRLRECVGAALARLWPVTADDFAAAMRDPADASAADAVACYEKGAFALWEPMPDWFVRTCQRPERR
ncbi:MAG: hypothetical protein MUF84_09850 [Anaerolineae bacterium]|nr:hypothetical protein [Anaerolineae bacterium]